ncbi:SRPBCC domain-containing protein [Cellulomonas sp. ICMP 17802]|uniref:SRPBCC domain-containing protein n=1 Tax=Cellulomonas sp. ICMP 17802 TaxID=3239199 RepID=UPI00351B3C36
MTSTTQRTQVHSTFQLERTYPAHRARVWAAFADADAKRRWFGGEGVAEFSDDVRVGGHQVTAGSIPGGPAYRYRSTYTDVVDGERLVATYDMWLDDAHISTSISTITLEDAPDGTHVTWTEQGVHLDGHDTGAEREHGTGELMDALGASLRI